MKEPELRLNDFSGNTLHVRAQVAVRVTSAQKDEDAEFYVIAGATSCLLGLSTSRALGLVTLSSEVVLTRGEKIALLSKKAA